MLSEGGVWVKQSLAVSPGGLLECAYSTLINETFILFCQSCPFVYFCQSYPSFCLVAIFLSVGSVDSPPPLSPPFLPPFFLIFSPVLAVLTSFSQCFHSLPSLVFSRVLSRSFSPDSFAFPRPLFSSPSLSPATSSKEARGNLLHWHRQRDTNLLTFGRD